MRRRLHQLALLAAMAGAVTTVTVSTTARAAASEADPGVIRLQLIVDDPALLGSLARFLMDEGLVVSAPVAGTDGITHVVMVGAGDGGLAIVCRGRETTASVVPPGPGALVELELGQRIKALVLSTPPLPAATTPAATTATTTETTTMPSEMPVVRLDVTDRTGGRELGDGLAVAILEAGVALGTVVPASRLCVVADDDVVEIGQAASVDGLCGDGQTLSRTTALNETTRWLVPLLPQRPPPASPPTTTTTTTAPTPRTTDTTTATTTATTTGTTTNKTAVPFSIGVQGGALGRLYGVDPLVVTDLSVWLWTNDVVGVPVVWGPHVVVGGSGSFGDVSIAEPFVGVGGVARTALSTDVTVSVGLVGGSWLHSWIYADVDAGVAVDPLVVVPMSAALALWPGIEGTLGLSVGSASRTRIHTVDGGSTWERARPARHRRRRPVGLRRTPRRHRPLQQRHQRRRHRRRRRPHHRPGQRPGRPERRLRAELPGHRCPEPRHRRRRRQRRRGSLHHRHRPPERRQRRHRHRRTPRTRALSLEDRRSASPAT